MIREKLLTINPYSRPVQAGALHQRVEGLVMHWVQNAGAPNEVHWNWWESRKDPTLKRGYGSAHYVIDDNEILLCVPENEVAYHVGAGDFPSERYTDMARRNFSIYPSARTIGIEMCHPNDEGWFTGNVLWQATWLASSICVRYDLNPMEDIYRHYDITGKDCPRYWMNHPEEFYKFKRNVTRMKRDLDYIKEGRYG